MWDGHEVVFFVSGFDPDGKPWPARFARAAEEQRLNREFLAARGL